MTFDLGCNICHHAVTLNCAHSRTSDVSDGLWALDPYLPFVLIIFPSVSASRLTPVLVNGMKYSEIDIILLKVSLYSCYRCLYLKVRR